MDFLAGIERFEVMLFFSGYIIIWTIVNRFWQKRMISGVAKYKVLVYSYLLIATLFIAFLARKFYLLSIGDPVFEHAFSLLSILGTLSITFWIPALQRIRLLGVLHSLLFFAFIPIDLIRYALGETERFQLRNDMNILALSVALNTLAFLIVLLAITIYSRYRSSRTV